MKLHTSCILYMPWVLGLALKVCNSHHWVIGASKQLLYMTFTCDGEGFKRSRENADNIPRPNSRIGCKAQMKIKRKGFNDNTWICTHITTEHNHDVNKLMSNFHWSHKKIEILDQQKIIVAHRSDISTSKVIQMLATEVGALKN